MFIGLSWDWMVLSHAWFGLPGGRFQSGGDLPSQQLLQGDDLHWEHCAQCEQRISIKRCPLPGWKERNTLTLPWLQRSIYYDSKELSESYGEHVSQMRLSVCISTLLWPNRTSGLALCRPYGIQPDARLPDPLYSTFMKVRAMLVHRRLQL